MNEAMERLVERTKAEYANVDVSMSPCLGQCGDCATQNIAMADDVLITADTTHELLERIKNAIGEHEVVYSKK
jgi:uncharacterized protein YuzB (UPF0349 family)